MFSQPFGLNKPSVAVPGPICPDSIALHLKSDWVPKLAYNMRMDSSFLKDASEGASATEAGTEFLRGIVQGKKLNSFFRSFFFSLVNFIKRILTF